MNNTINFLGHHPREHLVRSSRCYFSVKDATVSPFPAFLVTVVCQLYVFICVCSLPVVNNLLGVNNLVLSPRSVLQQHTESGYYRQGIATHNGSHSVTHGVSTLGNAFLFPTISVQRMVWLVLIMYRMSLFQCVARFILFTCRIVSLLTCTLPFLSTSPH